MIDAIGAMRYECRACPFGHLIISPHGSSQGRVSTSGSPSYPPPHAGEGREGGLLADQRQGSEFTGREKPSEGSLMFVKRHLGNLAAATGLALAAWGVGGVANAADPFTLTSATFKDGTMMPKKVANKNPQNPNCVGDNV